MIADMVRNILIIHVSRIGDTLLATPAMRAIATAYPHARITVLAHPNRAEVLRHLPFLSRVGTITKERAPFMGRLWRGQYDLAFVFGHDRPLVAYALRAARRVVAFSQNDPTLDLLLDPCVIPAPRHEQHAVDALFALPRSVGIVAAERRLAYRVTDAEVCWAGSNLARWLPNDAVPLIGLQMASFFTKAWRDWPLDNFSALCQRILAVYPQAYFLIFGGSEDKRRTATLHQRFPTHTTSLAGRLTLRQTAAIMSRLDLYVGVDTGPTHIMGCFDVPMVVLYHCESPSAVYAPLDHKRLYVIDHPRPVGECSVEASMAEISVDRVWEVVQACLRR